MGRVPSAGKEAKGAKTTPGCMEDEVRVLGLAYWPILGTPHCLDLMHIMKNVFESLFGTLLNMPERTKDGPKGRSDLIHMGIQEELHGGLPAIDHDQSEEEKDGPKGKRVKRNDYYYPPPASL